MIAYIPANPEQSMSRQQHLQVSLAKHDATGDNRNQETTSAA